jgi:hypothetical protein
VITENTTENQLLSFACAIATVIGGCMTSTEKKEKRKRNKTKKKTREKGNHVRKRGMNGLQKQRGNNPHQRENVLVL